MGRWHTVSAWGAVWAICCLLLVREGVVMATDVEVAILPGTGRFDPEAATGADRGPDRGGPAWSADLDNAADVAVVTAQGLPGGRHRHRAYQGYYSRFIDRAQTYS